MFIFCGVFYPVTTLPDMVQAAVEALPLTHAIALVRPLIAGEPLTQPALHVAVLLGYAAIGYYAAVVLVRRRLIV